MTTLMDLMVESGSHDREVNLRRQLVQIRILLALHHADSEEKGVNATNGPL